MRIKYVAISIVKRHMNENPSKAEKVVRYNEKFNVPEQTEQEEAETFENAKPENLAERSTSSRRSITDCITCSRGRFGFNELILLARVP